VYLIVVSEVSMTEENKTDNHIKIKVEGAGLLGLDKFEEFQGDLKTLDEESYQSLRKVIIRDGVTFVPHIWIQDDCDIKHHYILDGHQRIKTIRRMMKEDGFICPYLPYAETKAESFHRAKEILLTAASQYGKVTPKGLFEFMTENEIEIEDISVIRMPEIDMSAFKIDFFSDSEKKSVEFEAGERTKESQFIVAVFLPTELQMSKFFAEMKQRNYECKLIK
jgi:hypothetical protein